MNKPARRKCRICGCTDGNCVQCIRKTGKPCRWVGPDLCSACSGDDPALPAAGPKRPHRTLSRRIARACFTAGSGIKSDRLRHERGGIILGYGWGEDLMAHCIETVLDQELKP